jgi:hypothetical protein
MENVQSINQITALGMLPWKVKTPSHQQAEIQTFQTALALFSQYYSNFDLEI